MEDIEARSRLASLLDVWEYEMHALDALHDARLSGGVSLRSRATPNSDRMKSTTPLNPE
jgi:hypothetical protein